ncbi:hypothetical protein ACMFMG_010115 [Clarireedia jacksonii]
MSLEHISQGNLELSMAPPPRRRKSRASEAHLPKGGCRFILIPPATEQLRCACTGFSLNRTIPGSSCDCGHQAVYHTAESNASDKQEIEALKTRINMLEDELDKERSIGRGGLIDRLCRLEGLVEKSNAEREGEMKGVYRGISGIWQNVGRLDKQIPYYDDRIDGLVDDIHRIRGRVIDLDDASMRIEERLDTFESQSSPTTPTRSRRRKASTPPARSLRSTHESSPISDTNLSSDPSIPMKDSLHYATHQQKAPLSSVCGNAWTVHVSLMPTSTQPFPFERDTAAYKRCLSRGLHRKIVVPGTSGQSFTDAINIAFEPVLRGRAWRPLLAKICDVEKLRGLPMLRQLPDQLIDNEYDVEFLKNYCAVLDTQGNIEDLYIAMLEDKISWVELHRLEPFLSGLESAWAYDAYLDGPCDANEGQEEKCLDATIAKRAVGEILPSYAGPQSSPTSLISKRHAARISRSPSFDSATDEEKNRTKFRRSYTGSRIEIVGRCAETA